MSLYVPPGEGDQPSPEQEGMARLKQVVEQLQQVTEDMPTLDQMIEKSAYWRTKTAEAAQKAGMGADPNLYVLLMRTLAMQDLFDVMDPSGALRKKFEILFNEHATIFWKALVAAAPGMKLRQAAAEAQAVVQNGALRHINGKP